MRHIIEYIIQWLCYGDSEAAKRIAYSADEKLLLTHDILIVPNGHLGKDIILPDMSRPKIEEPKKGKTIIRTDIVYNTFFFISRAEECINNQRDEHGRFLAKYSILGRHNQLQIPMLDEYARMLLKMLKMPLPTNGFGHIYLTHDIDSLTQYRHWRGGLGGLWRKETQQVWNAWCDIHRDPLYTFPWIIEQDSHIRNAETIYFIKRTHGRGYDYPQYCLCGHDYRQTRQLLVEHGARIGLHSSYYGIQNAYRDMPLHNRSHYLRCSIEQMRQLVQIGITDDYTMGFADQAGFRLQTSRAVRWIDPVKMELTPLTLHPLLIMDTTLSNANYMNLSEDEAYFLCERLIEKVRMHHGDLCVLWHNNSFTPDTYHRSLYSKLLDLLQDS